MNWPWKRKPVEDAHRWWWADDWDKVKERYPVGKTFTYLGRKMVVTQHANALSPSGRHAWPELVTEYIDNSGKLHEWAFEARMFKLLLGPLP